MIPIAILSNIHGNLEALNAVLSDIAEQKISTIISLGDAVGYGPDPLACLQAMRVLTQQCLMGYLEFHIVNALEMEFSSPLMIETLRYAGEALRSSNDDWNWLRCLPVVFQDARYVAANTDPRGIQYSPSHPEQLEHSDRTRVRLFSQFSHLFLMGGSHAPWVATESGHVYTPHQEANTYLYTAQQKLVVSVGSVGQPRDGDPRACYAILTENEIRWRRVEYDIKLTAHKAIERYAYGSVYAEAITQGIPI